MRSKQILALIATTAVLSNVAESKLSNATFFYNKTRPLVLAHRGASG